jgi:hypothetical protein
LRNAGLNRLAKRKVLTRAKNKLLHVIV